MLDSFYHMTLKTTLKSHFCVKTMILTYTCDVITGRHYITLPKSVNHKRFINFNACIIFLPDTTSY